MLRKSKSKNNVYFNEKKKNNSSKIWTSNKKQAEFQ